MSEYFYELRNQIDIDTEEHLKALIESNLKNIEMSRVQVNNVRSDLISLLKKIEDELKVAKANGVKNKRCTFTIDLIAFLFFIGMKVKIKILFGFFSGITSIEAKETL